MEIEGALIGKQLADKHEALAQELHELGPAQGVGIGVLQVASGKVHGGRKGRIHIGERDLAGHAQGKKMPQGMGVVAEVEGVLPAAMDAGRLVEGMEALGQIVLCRALSLILEIDRGCAGCVGRVGCVGRDGCVGLSPFPCRDAGGHDGSSPDRTTSGGLRLPNGHFAGHFACPLAKGHAPVQQPAIAARIVRVGLFFRRLFEGCLRASCQGILRAGTCDPDDGGVWAARIPDLKSEAVPLGLSFGERFGQEEGQEQGVPEGFPKTPAAKGSV